MSGLSKFLYSVTVSTIRGIPVCKFAQDGKLFLIKAMHCMGGNGLKVRMSCRAVEEMFKTLEYFGYRVVIIDNQLLCCLTEGDRSAIRSTIGHCPVTELNRKKLLRDRLKFADLVLSRGTRRELQKKLVKAFESSSGSRVFRALQEVVDYDYFYEMWNWYKQRFSLSRNLREHTLEENIRFMELKYLPKMAITIEINPNLASGKELVLTFERKSGEYFSFLAIVDQLTGFGPTYQPTIVSAPQKRKSCVEESDTKRMKKA